MAQLARASCLIVVLAACGPAPPRGPSTSVRLGADVDAGTLDPRLMRNTTAYRANNLLYDGLVLLGPRGTPRPGLAESWENPEPTVWLFHLRPGVRFHDGSALSARDVVFTLESILDPEIGSPSRPLLLPVQTVTALDSLTVRMDLSEAYAPLLRYLDVGIVPTAYVRSGGDPGTEPVGTGPMRLVAWERGSRILLEANADYWGGAPSMESFEFVVVPDNTARAQALEAGDLDIIQSPLSPRDIERLSADPRLVGTVTDGLAVTYLNFNTRAGLLHDPALRRALAMLIDRATIVDVIYEGVDRVATSILLPAFPGFDDAIRQPPFDPRAAQAALARLGWRDTDDDGLLDRDGAPLSIELSTHSEDPNRIQALEYVQATLLEAGVDARVTISDWPSFFADVQAGQHEIALLGWTQLVDPDRLLYGQLTTGGGLNYGAYSDARVDSLLAIGRSSTDEGERARAYRGAAEIIAFDLPFLVLSYQSYQVFHAAHVQLVPDVRGMMRSAIGF